MAGHEHAQMTREQAKQGEGVLHDGGNGTLGTKKKTLRAPFFDFTNGWGRVSTHVEQLSKIAPNHALPPREGAIGRRLGADEELCPSVTTLGRVSIVRA